MIYIGKPFLPKRRLIYLMHSLFNENNDINSCGNWDRKN
jgi:hypothetical protein